jgi:predicted transcriptional regulator
MSIEVADDRDTHWFKINNEIFDLGLNCYEIAVYNRLVFRGSPTKKQSFESVGTIAKALNASVPTVRNAIKRLVELNVVIVENRFNEKQGQTSNLYRLKDKSAWKLRSGGIEESEPTLEASFPPPRSQISRGVEASFPPPRSQLSTNKTQSNKTHSEQDPEEEKASEKFQREKHETKSPSPSASVPALSKPSDDSLNLKGIENPEASISLAKDWLQWANKQSPWKTGFTLHNFAEAILTIQRQGKFNHEPVRHLFEYIKRDDFWAKNAISPAGLTKRKNGDMRKWETIMHQMKANRGYRTEVVQEKLKTRNFERLF